MTLRSNSVIMMSHRRVRIHSSGKPGDFLEAGDALHLARDRCVLCNGRAHAVRSAILQLAQIALEAKLCSFIAKNAVAAGRKS